MPRGCHTVPPLASRREERFAHAEYGLLTTDHFFKNSVSSAISCPISENQNNKHQFVRR
jgi:hypothetical protein